MRRSAVRTSVLVSGELDLATAVQLRAALTDLLAEDPPPRQLVVDLRELDFMDVTGLSVLLAAGEEIAVLGGLLAIARPSAMIRRMIGLLDLEDRLPIESG